MFITKKQREIYEKQPAQALVMAHLIDNLILTKEWELIDACIGEQIELYREKLETCSVQDVEKVQYACMNMKNLRSIPKDISDELKNMGFASPPSHDKSDFGFTE